MKEFIATTDIELINAIYELNNFGWDFVIDTRKMEVEVSDLTNKGYARIGELTCKGIADALTEALNDIEQ